MLPYPTIDPVLIQIGPIAIRWYSLAYIIGIFGGFHLFQHAFKDRYGLNKDQVINLMTATMIGIILGGRLGYVLFYDLGYYLSQPSHILALWSGGMSFHGGAIGAMIAFILYARYHKHNPLGYLDLLGLGSTIGLGLGRLANFINGELYGKVTDVPWAMVFPDGGPLPRHPSQLYEAGLEGVLLGIILYVIYKKNTYKPGQLFAAFMCLYGIFRFSVEFFREPDAHLGAVLGSLSMGQCLSLVMIGCGLSLFMALHRQGRKDQE